MPASSLRATIGSALFAAALVVATAATAAPARSELDVLFRQFSAAYAGGQYPAAAAAARRMEAAAKARFGTHHPNYAAALNNLGLVHAVQARYAEAEAFYKRALAIHEKSGHQANIGGTLHNLAAVYRVQARHAEAERLSRRALAVRERALGADHLDVAATLTDLGNVLLARAGYGEAEATFRRSLAIREKALPAVHPDLGAVLNDLGIVCQELGKYAEAERFYGRALAIRERGAGQNPVALAATLNNLANLFTEQGRAAEAEPIHRRVLEIRTKALGPEHHFVGMTLNNLASIMQARGRLAEAETLNKRALAIFRKVLGEQHSDYGNTLSNLANVYHDQGRPAEAEELYRQALAIKIGALGEQHPEVAQTLNNLANVHFGQGRVAESVGLHQRALAMWRSGLGESNVLVATSLDNLAYIESTRGAAAAALKYTREATAALVSHARQNGQAGAVVESRRSVLQQHLARLVVAARDGVEPEPALGREAFEVAQWVGQSSAAAAVQQMAARFAAGDGPLAVLVRELQDLGNARQTADKALLAALANPQAGEAAALRQRIAELERRAAAASARLQAEFPDYAAAVRPDPLRAEDVQRLLADDEALVVFIPGVRQSHVVALTAAGIAFAAIPLTVDALASKAAAFRRGLELADPSRADRSRLFDLALGHDLYRALFGSVEALVKDKRHLLIVPSGPLTAMPFHLLVTDPPAAAVPAQIAGYRDAAWLLRRHAVTVLPAVASIKALRVLARREPAARPLIGFADPVFGPEPPPGPAAPGRSAVTRAYTDFWRGAAVDRARLAEALPRLEDTADELRTVAQKLGAGRRDVHLREAASETAVKKAALADYRVVYFATHGLVAGDVKGLAEPSLALTIPKAATTLDDGLLTASEVAQLKLNADWVVLSACNTIAGDTPGAEALSGLARAFFYAGARALLVSHWAVDSAAATRLTISTFANLQADPAIGRAEALRRAMLADMRDETDPNRAYPGRWGPFALIGEGAAR